MFGVSRRTSPVTCGVPAGRTPWTPDAYDGRVAVTDEAIEKIKDMIVRGELAPGSRLPPEKDLADRLGLSRNSMREAIKALEVIRVLDVRRGDGTYVTSLEPRLLLEAVSFVVDLHDDDSLLEIFAVRRILESRATGLAAQYALDSDIAALNAEIDSMFCSFWIVSSCCVTVLSNDNGVILRRKAR